MTRLARLLRRVAQRRQVGDQPQEPEQQRDGEVGGDREHVPHQRALELRPDALDAGIRQQPVGGEPGPAGVEEREQQGAHDREQGHRLGEAVDRRAPLLLEQQQDGGDQGAGVADTDPPDEVDDVEGPADRDVVPPGRRCPRRACSRGRSPGSPASPGRRRSRPTSPCPAPRQTWSSRLSLMVRVGVLALDEGPRIQRIAGRGRVRGSSR